MRKPNLRVSRLLRSHEVRLAVLGTAIIASTTMLVTSTTDGETFTESAVVTVAPTTSAKAHPKSAPAEAVPLTVAEPVPSTTGAPPPAPTEAAPAPSTTAKPAPVAAARQAPAPTTAPVPELETAPPPTTTTPPPPVAVKRCAVRLHGKGGGGGGTYVSGDVTYVAPTGNASGWGGRQWLYFPDSAYSAAVGIVASAIDAEGCTRVTVVGFSNGGAFAAKLYCKGESFGGRLAGVIVDDPVVDNAVNGCAPAAGVAVTLYWTGALAGQSYPGWRCADADWTCDGGTTIGIDAYAAALGTPAKPSPMGGHSPYTNPPELLRF